MSYHTPSGQTLSTTATTTVVDNSDGTQSSVSTVTIGSSNIFAYYAGEEENETYFPNFQELKDRDSQSIPFSFVKVTKDQKYVVENLFNTEEGFSVQFWFTNSLDAAYGIGVEEENFVKGEQALKGNNAPVEFIAQGEYLFAGTFQHNIVGDPDPYGYKMKGSISEVEEVKPDPSIEPEDLFLIQHEDELYRIPAADLKDYFASLAKKENLKENFYGKPGLVYPGSGLKYDEVSGKIDADIPARPKFKGIVSQDIVTPVPFNKLSPDSSHPMREVTVVAFPDGNEQEGDYYVVYDTEMTLTESWGFSSGTRVFRGDAIIRVRQGDTPGNFEIQPSIEGATSVQSIIAGQNAIEFDFTDIQFPNVNIKTAKAVGEVNETPEGFDGFLSKEDKNVINRLPVDYTEQDFTKYPGIE